MIPIKLPTVGGTFVADDECDRRTARYGVSDDDELEMHALLGGWQDGVATRPEDGGMEEELVNQDERPMPVPSIGANVNADKGQMMKDGLLDSRSRPMEMEEGVSLLDVPQPRGCQGEVRGGQEALYEYTRAEPSIGVEHSVDKGQMVKDALLDPECHDVRDGRRTDIEVMLDPHAPVTGQDWLMHSQGGLQIDPTPEPSTSSPVVLPDHATGVQAGVNMVDDFVLRTVSWTESGAAGDTVQVDRSSPVQQEDRVMPGRPVALECDDDEALRPGGREEELIVTDSTHEERGSSTPGPKVCTYTKGKGVCDIHGPGAKYHWRPIKKEDQVVGPDGKLKTRFHYWVCMLGPKGKRNLRQQKIQFGRMSNQMEGGVAGDSSINNNNNTGLDDSTTTGDN